ncbi:ATP-grasp domain-containing protein [Mesorhizobium mediterraneum]|uniref:ATP-grasp domain-containing protein n=1 Tax=Mesorhizobium mediterraneum TaxID=43617 RepID=UPI001FED7480|nr:ATP-grasp domain-containing protein [Mesorhizobium mediterraneum]
MKIALVDATDRAGLAVCRSLGRAGHDITHVQFGNNKRVADLSRYCRNRVAIGNPNIDLPRSALNLATALGDIDYVIPITDGAVELVYYARDNIKTTILGPPFCSLQKAKNKLAAISLVAPWLKAPPTSLVPPNGDISGIEFPCFAKPIFSSHIVDDRLIGTSVSFVKTANELERKIRDTPVPLLIQEPISGPGAGINFASYQGQLLGVSVTERLHEPGYGGGSSYRRSGKVTDLIIEVASGLSAALEWTGVMMIECKRHDGELYLMELNCRPWGSFNLSLFAGADYPTLVLNAFQGMGTGKLVVARENVFARHLKKDIGWVLRNPQKLFHWLASFRMVFSGTEQFDVERLSDPLPGMYQFVSAVGPLYSKAVLRLPHRTERHAIDVSKGVVFICKGNVNRSVVAAYVANQLGIPAKSGCLLTRSDRRASIEVERYIEGTLGTSAAGHRTTVLERAISGAENVVVFESRHVNEVRRRVPRHKVFLLSELAGESGDVADPDGRSSDVYEECFRRITDLVRKAFG